jgi:phage terminase large subunit-like protein
MNKQYIISSIFYDPAGYGNARETLAEAKAKDPTITMDDVKQWRQSNVETKTKPRGFNTFVSSKPLAEFQIDLLFFPT